MEQIPPMNGYSKLASSMGAHPELAIFRRFGTLNAQNLLYLQAELVYLENKLQKCVKTDAASGHMDRMIYDHDWQTLFESTSAPDGNPEQWDTAQSRTVVKVFVMKSRQIYFGFPDVRYSRLYQQPPVEDRK